MKVNLIYMYNEPFMKSYAWFKAYGNYPVVNISKKGAMNYCEWMSKQFSLTKRHERLKCRLPSKEEFFLLYQDLEKMMIPDTLENVNLKTDYENRIRYFNNGKVLLKHSREKIMKTSGDDLKASLKSKLDEFGYLVKTFHLHDEVYHTAHVSSFQQTKSGLCSLVGNVAELTNSGEAVGGHWDSLPSQVFEMDTVRAPDPRIGFRIVLEVLN